MILVNLIQNKMDPISKLTEYFREFPGIGPRQARRFVYFLLTRNSAFLEEVSHLILEIKKNIKMCSSCFRFYQNSNEGLCNICKEKNRDKEQLMIVARDIDFETVERSGFYNGLYFILGGTIPILDKDPEKRVRIKELIQKINDGKFKEIILSLNSNSEGENTANYIRTIINNTNPNIKISVLGKGLSTGSELEYTDAETIKNALRNREEI